MPRTVHPPSYRLHRARNCAVVTINGHNHYLGRYGSPESYEEYTRLITAWQAGVVQLGPSAGSNGAQQVVSNNDLILAYWTFAKSHYVKDGRPTHRADQLLSLGTNTCRRVGRAQRAPYALS
jgi:hypothetical protein